MERTRDGEPLRIISEPRDMRVADGAGVSGWCGDFDHLARDEGVSAKKRKEI